MRFSVKQEALKLLERWLGGETSPTIQKETYTLLNRARGILRYQRYYERHRERILETAREKRRTNSS